MKASDSLYQEKPEPQKPKRIDLAFEQVVVCCGIGCLINDMPMDENDYVRLELAFSRLLSQGK